MIALVAAAFAVMGLAWALVGVPQVALFFGFLTGLYAAIWALRVPRDTRPRRVRADWRYCR